MSVSFNSPTFGRTHCLCYYGKIRFVRVRRISANAWSELVGRANNYLLMSNKLISIVKQNIHQLNDVSYTGFIIEIVVQLRLQ